MTDDWFSDIINSGIDLGQQGLNITLPYITAAEEEIKKRLSGSLFDIDTNDDLEKINDTTLGQNKYDFTQRIFPSDLGEHSYNGHYMVINVNVSNFSQYNGQINGPQGAIQTFSKLNNELSKVDALRSVIDKKYTASTGKPLGVGWWAPRQTRRIAESVAVYMPNSVTYMSSNEETPISLTNEVRKGISSTFPLAGRVLNTTETTLNFLHKPINPRTEVIFANTNLREFRYDFLFSPSNPVESANLEQIIQTMRFHAAPEFNGLQFGINGINALQALLWIPPSEFDITFYNKGKENRHIPKVNTCVLKDCIVDYAPSGIYSTFSNGYPVQVRMQLNFLETEVVHKLRVAQGF